MRRAATLLPALLLACGSRTDPELVQADGGAPAVVVPEAAPPPDHADGSAPPQHVDGIAYASCAPNDGPAFTIVVAAGPAAAPQACSSLYAEASPPFDVIEVDQAFPTTPESMTILGSGQLLSCQKDPQAQPTLCRAASAVALTIDSVSATALSGTYSMSFSNGTQRGRSFTVLVCSTGTQCG